MVHSLILTLVALSAAVAAPKSATWQADYGKALAATRADDRPLLVVLDVPSDPKTAVEGKQLKTDGKQADLLASYQLCHVDASTEYGKRVARAFKAQKFPLTTIIDKTGSIVLLKKQGQLSDEEWNETLQVYKKGDRSLAKFYSSAYRGNMTSSGSAFSPSKGASLVNPSYCPSCQRNAQQNF